MNDTNARDEFVEHIKAVRLKIKAVLIFKEDNCNDDATTYAFLKIGYRQEDFNGFLNRMDFEYDSGYGGQELYGTIWYEDGTWSSRGEYDGSEWWEHNSVPIIPEELK